LKSCIAEILKAVQKVLVCLKWNRVSASLFEALTSFLIISRCIIREMGTVSERDRRENEKAHYM
jgi:hypothetical protein